MRISDWSSDVCSSDLILVAEKYMKYAPEGGAAGWTLNSATKSLITPVSGSGDRASRVCISARIKAKMPSPSTILKCDGSDAPGGVLSPSDRSEEHTSELQSLMRISYAVFCLKK